MPDSENPFSDFTSAAEVSSFFVRSSPGVTFRTMKNLLLLLILCCACSPGPSANLNEDPWNKTTLNTDWPGDIYINSEADAPFYLLASVSAPEGLLVILPAGGERVEDLREHLALDDKAIQAGWSVMIPAINWSSFTAEQSVDFLSTCLKDWASRASLPPSGVVIGGLSNGGMVALHYGIASARNPEAFPIQPSGIYALDTALDHARFFDYCEREIKRNYSPAGVAEAQWIRNMLLESHSGSPAEVPEAYLHSSVYSTDHPQGGNAQHLMRTPLRLYSDLDVDWLIEERHRNLYDWNGTDMVAMTNTLRLMGHPDVSIQISQGKGVRPDGSRHPHSWSIMPDEDLLAWMAKLQ